MKILTVEDDATSRKVLGAILQKLGHEVVTAANGREALAVFARERPDLVMMDVMMPEMDGYDAARAIKERCGTAFVPVIFLTALTDDEALAKCVACGGDDFLPKPYNRTLIKAKIDAMARIRALHQAVAAQRDALERHHIQVEEDSRLARQVFEAATAGPPTTGVWLRSLNWASGQWSGDMALCAQAPSGRIHAMLGDFTGHGLAAAVGTLPAADVFYALTAQDAPIADIAAALNAKLRAALPSGYFCAGALVGLDRAAGAAQVWNGGLPPLLVLDAGARIVRRVASTKPPLRVVAEAQFDRRVECIPLGEGFSLVWASDGLIEAQDAAGVRFGQARFEAAIAGAGNPLAVFETVRQQLAAFRRDCPVGDDISLVHLGLLAEPTAPARVLRMLLTDSALDLRLPAEALHITDPMSVAAAWLERLSVASDFRRRTYAVLAELVTNAIDHGVLGLASELRNSSEGFDAYYRLRQERLGKGDRGDLHVALERMAGPGGTTIRMRVQDSGPGFDPAKFLLPLGEVKGFFGRGIALVRALGADPRYRGCGNTVEVEYSEHAVGRLPVQGAGAAL